MRKESTGEPAPSRERTSSPCQNLEEIRSLFLEYNKVDIAIQRLRSFEPPEGFYLAHSGGKDSQVIHRLAQMAGVKFDAHFNVTTVDPPELVHFIQEMLEERRKKGLPDYWRTDEEVFAWWIGDHRIVKQDGINRLLFLEDQ